MGRGRSRGDGSVVLVGKGRGKSNVREETGCWFVAMRVAAKLVRGIGQRKRLNVMTKLSKYFVRTESPNLSPLTFKNNS